MARKTLTYGGKNLNDGATWHLLPGFDPGAPEKSYDERQSYSGAVAQYNVSEAHFVEMTVPLLLTATSLSNLQSEVNALNALIDAGEKTLVFGSDSYNCAHSQRISVVYDEAAMNLSALFVTFRPLRYP